MSSDLNITTATFGTSDLNGDTSDVFPSTVWTQLGDNTGYNFYRPALVAVQDSAVTAGASRTDKAYMAAGTYQAYCASHMDLNTVLDYGTVSLDGTLLVSDSGGIDTWVTGNAEVIISATGWVDVLYETTESDSASIDRTSIFTRQKA